MNRHNAERSLNAYQQARTALTLLGGIVVSFLLSATPSYAQQNWARGCQTDSYNNIVCDSYGGSFDGMSCAFGSRITCGPYYNPCEFTDQVRVSDGSVSCRRAEQKRPAPAARPSAPPPSPKPKQNVNIVCPPGSSQACQWCKNNPEQASSSICTQYTASAAQARSFPSCYAGPTLVYTDASGKCVNFAALKDGDSFMYRGVPITYRTGHSGTFAEMVQEQYNVKQEAQPAAAGRAAQPQAHESARKTEANSARKQPTSGKCVPVDENGAPCVSGPAMETRYSYTIRNERVYELIANFTNSCNKTMFIRFTRTNKHSGTREAGLHIRPQSSDKITCLSDACSAPLDSYEVTCN